MFRNYYPDIHVPSVFNIDYQKLYQKGYRGIIFDLDNTLVHHGDDSTPEIDALFHTIHGIGLKTIILSDNTEERILCFLKNIDSPYISDANKPDIQGYQKALTILGVSTEQVVCIGDQVFTDIYGANCAGIANILVDFIRLSDEKRIGKKRWLEKFVLLLCEGSSRHTNRIGNIYIEKTEE